jgi:hypothetical protein
LVILEAALATGFTGLLVRVTMNTSEEQYRRICDEVWALYQAQLEKEKPRWNRQRHVLLPPPPRTRNVDLLVVGISPSQVAPIAYATERASAEQFAREFEYISQAGTHHPKYSNDAYYQPVLQFARRLDPRFGVWPEVSAGDRSLLLEFTDALHIATDHRIPDDFLTVMNPQAEFCPVCARCKEILEAELRLYRPRIVMCNGRLPSKFLYEICTGRSVERPVTETLLKETPFGCKVHFSGYLDRKWMDGYSRARLLREIRENTVF